MIVITKPVDIFKETSGQFLVVFVTTKPGILSQNRISVPDPNQMFFVSKTNPNITTALSNVSPRNIDFHHISGFPETSIANTRRLGCNLHQLHVASSNSCKESIS